jgi:hypothetical protein
MKIIQPAFKDYYDYVQGLYEGGDPKIVYVRNHVVPPQTIEMGSIKTTHDGEWEVPHELKLYMHGSEVNHDPKTGIRTHKYYRGIFVAGRYWLFRRVTKEVDLVEREVEPWAIFEMSPRRRQFQWLRPEDRFENGQWSDRGIEISRALKVPVFAVEYALGRKLIVMGRVPRLTDYGFGSIVPAEQMYQEIAGYVSNTMNPSPDTMPVPTNTSDVQKALAHGFDKRISFRHRK